MDNMYEYMKDKAKEVILEARLATIEYITEYEDGYIAIGNNEGYGKEIYYIWLDEEYGWSWHQLQV